MLAIKKMEKTKMENDNDEIKKMKSRIAKLDDQQEKLKAKKRALRARLSQQARKARTKRLIEKGAVLEKFQGKQASQITPEQTQEHLERLAHCRNEHVRLQALEQFAKKICFSKNPDDNVLSRFEKQYKTVK